jgi:O-acetyl-ADP-ribose deacetylase
VDITTYPGDAIVNAAKSSLLGGGGVDGAIHRAAGQQLLAHCRRLPDVDGERCGTLAEAPNSAFSFWNSHSSIVIIRCPTGGAVITPGFGLPATHIIHAVGPVYRDEETSAPLLGGAYTEAISLAAENRCVSVAFPAISCGFYGYPVLEAAYVAVRAIKEAVRDTPLLTVDLCFVDHKVVVFVSAAR